MLPGVTRVLAIGDSNTFGIYLKDSESYPAQLESRWNASHPDNTIKIINAGYPGASSHRLASIVDQMAVLTRPDIVLLSIGVADFFSASAYLESDTGAAGRLRSLWSGFPHFPALQKLARKHQPDSINAVHTATVNQRHLLQWSEDREELLSIVRMFKRANNTNPGDPASGDEFLTLGHQAIIMITAAENNASAHKERGFHHLQHNLSCIRRKVEAHGATLYLMTYAASSGVFARANMEIRTFSKTNPGMHFIDVARKIKDICPDSTQCPDLFFGDLHPTAEGYATVANLVAAGLEKSPGEPLGG